MPTAFSAQPFLCEKGFSAAWAFSWLPLSSRKWCCEHLGQNLGSLWAQRPPSRFTTTSLARLSPMMERPLRVSESRDLKTRQALPPHTDQRPQAPGRQAGVASPALAFFLRRASSPSSQQQARPQPCCKVLTHTEHSLSPRTLLAPSSSCADILIVLLWELAGSLSSGMARRGARAGCWLWLLLREAAHSDRLSNNLNLLRRACGTPAGPLYLLH